MQTTSSQIAYLTFVIAKQKKRGLKPSFSSDHFSDLINIRKL